MGTESPTFILPIAGRKDGLQAMFAKQAASTPSQQSQGVKRKRSASPKPSGSTMQAQKTSSQEKTNPPIWEDDSEIQCVDRPISAEKVQCRVRLYVCKPPVERAVARNRRWRQGKSRITLLHYPPRR